MVEKLFLSMLMIMIGLLIGFNSGRFISIVCQWMWSGMLLFYIYRDTGEI